MTPSLQVAYSGTAPYRSSSLPLTTGIAPLLDRMPVLECDQPTRDQIKSILSAQTKKWSKTPTTPTEHSLRRINTFAQQVRAEMSSLFGSFIQARSSIIVNTGHDPAHYSHALKQLWDKDVPQWIQTIGTIHKTANQQLKDLSHTLNAYSGQVVQLYHPNGESFMAEVGECTSSDMLGTYITFRSLRETSTTSTGIGHSQAEYEVSLAQFQRMQQAPVAYGPRSEQPQDITNYIQKTFAQSSMRIQSIKQNGKHWHIDYATAEGRSYTITTQYQSTIRGSSVESKLVITTITDWQNILTSSHYDAFIKENLTSATVHLLCGKNHLLHEDSTTFGQKPTKVSFTERTIAKVKRWFA